MHIVLTGGAGFIGSNFIKLALRDRPDCRITNLDVLTYSGNLENLTDIENDERYSFVKGDVRDPESLDRVLSQRRRGCSHGRRESCRSLDHGLWPIR